MSGNGNGRYTLKLFNGWNIPRRIRDLGFHKSQVAGINKLIDQSDLIEIGAGYKVYKLKGV